MDANGFFLLRRESRENPKCTSSYTQKYMRAVLPVIKGRGGHSSGRVRVMSAYQSNVKVEPPCVARSARTPGSIVTSSTTNDSKESAPSPMLRMGSMHENEGTPTTSAVHAFGNEQPTGCDHAPAMGCKAKRAAWGCRETPASWSGRSAWPRIY